MSESIESETSSHPPYRAGTVSFDRRSGRMTPRQKLAWDTYRSRYILDLPRANVRTSVDPTVVLDSAEAFGRAAPLVVEIGSGQGQAVVAGAESQPDMNFLAVEVYGPGLAQTVHRAARREVTNIRLLQANAVEVLATALPEGSVDELWVFFPDPWHKLRHRKRRLVTAEFSQLVTRVLRAPSAAQPGGLLRLATDWAPYAAQMFEVLDAAEGLVNVHGAGVAAPRFEGRALTGFERKARLADRGVTDLAYRRV